MNIKSLFKPKEKISLELYLNKIGIEDIDYFFNPNGKFLEDSELYTNAIEVKNLIKEYVLGGDSNLSTNNQIKIGLLVDI